MAFSEMSIPWLWQLRETSLSAMAVETILRSLVDAHEQIRRSYGESVCPPLVERA